MSTEALREAASIVAAVGVLAFLLPLEQPLPPAARRGVGLGLMGIGWAVLGGTLLPGGAADDLGAARVLAALVVLVLVLAVLWLAVRAVLSRPWIWFVLLALALPIRVPVELGSQEANLLVPLYAVIGLGLVAWIAGRIRGADACRPSASTPIDLPLGLFSAYLVLSSLWSGDPEEAAIKVVFFYLPFVVLFRLVVAWWPAGGALRALGITTVALAVPVSLLAVAQYVVRGGIYWNETLQQANVYSSLFRVNSIFFDPNILGRFLVIAILAALAMAWVARGRGTLIALGASVAVTGAGLAVTFSRSAALGLIAGLGLLAWYAFGWKRTLAVGGVLVVLFGAAALVGSDNVRRAATSTERLDQVSEGRFDLLEGGLTIWRSEPVAGAGLGGFEDRFEASLDPSERRRIRVIVSHNTPVTVLSEGGVVGFVLLLGLLGMTAFSIARGSRVGGASGWAQWALLAMLASIFVHSLLYSALFEDPFTWVIAGGALAIGAAAHAPATETAREAPPGAVAEPAT